MAYDGAVFPFASYRVTISTQEPQHTKAHHSPDFLLSLFAYLIIIGDFSPWLFNSFVSSQTTLMMNKCRSNESNN